MDSKEQEDKEDKVILEETLHKVQEIRILIFNDNSNYILIIFDIFNY